MRALLWNVVLIVAVTAASIAIGLAVTPMQSVPAAGQTVEVGATAPSLSVAGPGELDLFGQQIETTTTFAGPVRPRVRLTQITLNQQLTDFTHHASGASAAQSLETALVDGWRQYFVWELAIVGASAVVLLGAISGWLRRGRGHTAAFVVVGLVVVEAVNLGAIMVTAYTAPQKLSQVHSLQDLVGTARAPDLTPRPAPPTGTRVAVIGDSTAAGYGLQPVRNPTPVGRVCRRSRDSYAMVLAKANGWDVTNLACSGATIAEGILAPQTAGTRTLPAQMQEPAVAKASTVILSVGANDVSWSGLLQACAISSDCDNLVAEAYFQQRLAGFSADYLRLLSDLQALPTHPRVLINLYYNPFSTDSSCLHPIGMTDAKQRSMERLLGALNSILSEGAKAADFTAVQPDFTDHGVCSAEPYVQGLKNRAPFHPTAAGELAIALADEQALIGP
ncbi:MAG TPA: SGNH/GDSL hydrolase family protein [Nocardioidaceae bacterium]|nr:SGNH/GDSL hydrolase family protein [Nocardioidaceae bacterium]